MKKNWTKWIIVIILIVIVTIVIVKKSNPTKSAAKLPSPKTDTIGLDTTAIPNEPSSETLAQEIKSQLTKLDKNTLAFVNDFKITQDYFDKRNKTMPEQLASQYKNDKEGFLEQLIIRELLYQEADKKGFSKNLENISDTEQRKDQAINNYILDFTNKIQVSEKEIQAFYNARKADMKGATYDQVKNDIKNYLTQQKQGELFPQLIDNLMNTAKITKNEQWINQQRALKPENPLDNALQNGKPTVLDLGSATCVPCKMMKPIFEQLEVEYKDRANIIILDIYENRDLSSKYQVRVIPTQIFFDQAGNQNWRHEGYLAKEEIIKKLKELGVE